MRGYLKFLATGLILGLFTEFELRLIAGINPRGFVLALFFYPLIISFAFAGSVLLDRTIRSLHIADLIHYALSAILGLFFEWTVMGNGPGSNAFQLGMIAMWTTFCFGPRVLNRYETRTQASNQRFWKFFATTAVLLVLTTLLIANPKARLVVSVLGLSAQYIVMSLWLLLIGWRSAARNVLPVEDRSVSGDA